MTGKPNPATAEQRRSARDFAAAGKAVFALAVFATVLLAGAVAVVQLRQGEVNAVLERIRGRYALETGIYFEGEGNLEGAARMYRTAFEAPSAGTGVHTAAGLALIRVYKKLGEYEQTVAVFDALPSEAFPESGMLTGVVAALAETGALERAAEAGARWLEMAREEGDAQQMEWALWELGRIWEQRGDADQALACYREAAELQPASSAALRAAMLLDRKGRSGEALAVVERVLKHAGPGQLRKDAEALHDRLERNSRS